MVTVVTVVRTAGPRRNGGADAKHAHEAQQLGKSVVNGPVCLTCVFCAVRVKGALGHFRLIQIGPIGPSAKFARSAMIRRVAFAVAVLLGIVLLCGVAEAEQLRSAKPAGPPVSAGTAGSAAVPAGKPDTAPAQSVLLLARDLPAVLRRIPLPPDL